jgi:predicted house-cleaning noncanonical NTP pyrophosphatase (MazG superfamily)
MSLKKLIDNQVIIIDDHKRGSRESKDWDNPDVDVHIDKSTNFKVDGIRQKVRIKIPINSDRPITIKDYRNSNLNHIPNKLNKEITEAFADKDVRERFMVDLIKVLKEFNTILGSEERVSQILENISKHFNLKWTPDKISIYTNDILTAYTQFYQDQIGNLYFMTVDTKRIKIGQKNGHYKFYKGKLL